MSTSLTVSETRAKFVWDEVRAHPELILTVEDIPSLPRFAGWVPTYLQAAIDVLVARGSIVEAADGRLCVKPWEVDR